MRSTGIICLAVLALCCLLTVASAEPDPRRSGSRRRSGSKKSEDPEAAEADDVKDGKMEPGANRQKRFNLFQIVTFKNDACIASLTKNGTCYTASECVQKNGVSDGTCAQGYGICCTFTAGCGSSFAQNNTFFDSSSPVAGGCSAKVCVCSDNICQMRLDLNSFAISGPSTSSVTLGTKK